MVSEISSRISGLDLYGQIAKLCKMPQLIIAIWSIGPVFK
jgi:hypothetical protein